MRDQTSSSGHLHLIACRTVLSRNWVVPANRKCKEVKFLGQISIPNTVKEVEFKRDASPSFLLFPLPHRGRGIQGDGATTTKQGVRLEENIEAWLII